jgi:hypothetical protein
VDDDVDAPRRRRLGPVVALLVVAVGCVGIAVAWIDANRRVEIGTDTRCLFPDGRRVVVRRFRGPAHTPERELQLRDASLGVVWSVPIEHGSIDQLYELDDGVLYRHGETIEARNLTDGAVRWSAPIDSRWEYGADVLFRMLEEDVLEILDEPYGPGIVVRRRSLGTGALEWSTEPLIVPTDARLGW